MCDSGVDNVCFKEIKFSLQARSLRGSKRRERESQPLFLSLCGLPCSEKPLWIYLTLENGFWMTHYPRLHFKHLSKKVGSPAILHILSALQFFCERDMRRGQITWREMYSIRLFTLQILKVHLECLSALSYWSAYMLYCHIPHLPSAQQWDWGFLQKSGNSAWILYFKQNRDMHIKRTS